MTSMLIHQGVKRSRRRTAEAGENARRGYEDLGGRLAVLEAHEGAAAKARAEAQSLHATAGRRLENASTLRGYRSVEETALEGLHYVRAARRALGIDPGPPVPALPGRAKAGALKKDISGKHRGKTYTASPEPSRQNPHYHPGGMVGGRPVPEGWYSRQWWRSRKPSGGSGAGDMAVFNVLILPGYHDGAVEGCDPGAYTDNTGHSGGGDGGGFSGGGGFSDGGGSFDGGGDGGGGGGGE